MADESADVVIKMGPSPQSAAEAEKAAGQQNVEMVNEEAVNLKQDEKAILDNSGSMNSGITFLKVSGQSTLDNSKSFGASL